MDKIFVIISAIFILLCAFVSKQKGLISRIAEIGSCHLYLQEESKKGYACT
jgi:hypothetical protein